MQSEIFGKIALISQCRVLHLKEIFKYSLRSISYALAGHMRMMVKTKKSNLLIELEKGIVLIGQMHYRWHGISEKSEMFWTDLLPYS